MYMKSSIKSIHLICNAHLDPVWLWQRDEGIAEALSTFRTAADFCEEYENFIFCHNEVILYEWVEEHEPELFKRIQKLVKTGQWHIMGGWYLQPDCNMISGESLIRQITLGKEYFQEKFGVYPKTAINFDPFGHSRGMVQVLRKAGFESYLFMRPSSQVCSLPAETFRWQGYDGSELVGHRLFKSYLTLRGTACTKLQDFINSDQEHEAGAVTWGIGNHGGGPSRIDLEELNKYIKEHPELNIIHSTPDNYFKDIKKSGVDLPVYDKEMNYFAVGCYTSQILIKQQHRKLESKFTLTQKMASAAWLTTGYEYPAAKLKEAAIDLAFSEFHDILPGSGIKGVEDDSLQQISHGLEILSRLQTATFFAMLKGQKKAEDGDMPVFVWNPHPYPIDAVIECEMQLADQNWKETFFDIEVFDNQSKIASQIEQEDSKMNLDWRKKVVFETTLAAGSISRYECKPKEIQLSELPKMPKINGNSFDFDNGEISLTINRRTGLLDSFKVSNKELIRPSTGRILVMQDNADPWELKTASFKKRIGSFSLMNHAESVKFAGFNTKKLAPVRIIEDGPVRTVVEALMKYNQSTLRMQYFLPKKGTDIELQMQMNNQEANCMYKMSWLFIDKESECVAQDIFGRKKIPSTREEKVFSQWFAATSEKYNAALAIICDSGHGIDFFKGEMRYSLLRSPCYAAHPIGNRPLVTEDRVHDRIDVGLRNFKFKIHGAASNDLLLEMDKKAMCFAELMPVTMFYPSGRDKQTNPQSFIELSDSPAVLTCCRTLSDNQNLIIRIFNPTTNTIKTKLSILNKKITKKIELSMFEIKTFKVNSLNNSIAEVNGIE